MEHARVLDSRWLVDTTINLQGLPRSRNLGFMTGCKAATDPWATGAATLCLLPDTAARPKAEERRTGGNGRGLPVREGLQERKLQVSCCRGSGNICRSELVQGKEKCKPANKHNNNTISRVKTKRHYTLQKTRLEYPERKQCMINYAHFSKQLIP